MDKYERAHSTMQHRTFIHSRALGSFALVAGILISDLSWSKVIGNILNIGGGVGMSLKELNKASLDSYRIK